MKQQLRSLSRRAAALFLALVLAAPSALAHAGEQTLQTAIPVLDGLTYYNTITVNNDSRVESFSLELEEDSSVTPILVQGSGSVYGAVTINTAVSRAREAGLHVVGAINTDFFSLSTGVPIGIVIEDGVYKSSGNEENALLITDGQVSIMGHPQVELTLTNHTNDQTVTPHHFNKARASTGGLYLYNQDFSDEHTHSSGSGWFVRMKLTDSALPDLEEFSRSELRQLARGLDLEPEDRELELDDLDRDELEALIEDALTTRSLTVNSTLELEVTEVVQGEGALDIGADEYILTADDASGYDFIFTSFQVGDRITLRTSCGDEALSQAQWACGVGDILIQDGAVTDSSDWTYRADGRQPRSAIGMRADGTLVLYAADGRQSGYSVGLSEKDLADELLRQDCVWAVNVDGGGSTALSVWLPGQEGTALQNSPSGGSPRRCATYLLLVTDETGDGQASRLALTQEGQVLLTGTSLELPQAVALDEGLNLVETDLDEVTITSREELGEIEDGVYTAGDRAGTDILRLRDRDRDLEGTAQLHVVDALTSLTISRAGESGALTALTVEPGEQIQLTASGSYWGREALREWDADVITWTSEGDVGTVDDTGLYTAPEVPGEGSLTFTAGGISQTISVSPVYVHSDVTKEHWAYTAVEYCYAHGIVTGVSSTEFGRDNQIRRGDFMLMLYNALGRPAPAGTADFSDVSPDAYYYTALSWAQHAGLASGTGEGLFSPDAPITREQAFTILRQALPLLGKDCPDGDLSVLDQFSDRDQIAEYALGHTATLVEQGLVSGKGDGVDPRGNLTRAEMAAILYQAITFTPAEQPGEPTAPTEPTEPTEPADPTEPEDPVRPTDPEEPADPDQYALTLDVTEMILTAGDATTLTASVTPGTEGAMVTWTSSDPAAAAVAPDGTVTCLYTGTEPVFVTVTASWRGLTAQCAVLCAPGRPVGTVHDAELGLNIRSGPGTDQTVIGSLADGDQVVVLEALEGWYRILFLDEDGQAARGYVSADYLTVSE